MNWLIYTMFARQEYQFCKEIIAQQLEENYNQEYLFFIKVSYLYEIHMIDPVIAFHINKYFIPAFDMKFKRQ